MRASGHEAKTSEEQPMDEDLSPSLIRRDDERGIFAVHRSVYTDPAIYALEQERIFARCWLYAGHVSELTSPGDFIARTIASRRIFLSRDKEGTIRAFYNSCTHRGAMLCREARGNAPVLVCPYHFWSFDSAGRLSGVPDSESFGPDFERSDFDLARVARLDICHGFIFVSFAEAGESLADYLGAAGDYLARVADNSVEGMEIAEGSYNYSIATNWKFMVENSTDGYHVPATHRRYVDYMKTSSQWDLAGSAPPETSVTALGNGHCILHLHNPGGGKMTAHWTPALPKALRPKIEARRKAVEAKHGKERAAHICDSYGILQIFPNLLVMESVSTIVRQFFPAGPGKLDIRMWGLVPSELDEAERAHALRSIAMFWGPGGFGSADDVDILESCQTACANPEPEWSIVTRGLAVDRAARLDDDVGSREFWKRWHEVVAPEAPAAADQPKSNLLRFAARGA